MLSVEGLWADGDRGMAAVKDVSLAVRAGEIVGIAGVAGNGQRELAEAITGMRPSSRGVVRVDGRALRSGDPRAAIQARIAHVPEDRLHTAVAPSLSIASNAVLKSYRGGDHSRGPVLRLRAIERRARRLIAEFDVHTPGPTRAGAPPLRREPPEGRDRPGVRRDAARADRGRTDTRSRCRRDRERSELPAGRPPSSSVAVLLISEDLDEVFELADRIVVLYEGRIAGEVDASIATVEEVGLLMAGGARAARRERPVA